MHKLLLAVLAATLAASALTVDILLWGAVALVLQLLVFLLASLLVRGASFVRDMRAVEDRYREQSRELTLDEWMQQPVRSTILDNLARLTSALQ